MQSKSTGVAGLMDVYTLVIIITFVAFITLAALLLGPVYFFIKREEKASQEWTPEAISRRMREYREAQLQEEASPNSERRQ